MDKDDQFIKRHGRSIRMTLRNSKLSTDKLERRISLMRKSFKGNEDISKLNAIESKVRNIIDNTGKDQFSEEDIDIIMRQALGLEIREYDKSYLVNLESGEINQVKPHSIKEPKSDTFGDTTITNIGYLTYTDFRGVEDLGGIPYYKIDRQDKSGKVFTYKVFSHINIEMMETDDDYREAVLQTLLDENNMTKTNCGGYIGTVELAKHAKGLEDCVKANSKYFLVFDTTEATAVVKLRETVKQNFEEQNKDEERY